MRIYSFEKLVVWQLSRKFAGEVYLVTKDFPKEEKFGITSQIRRSALSVPTNIAEGSARISGKEKARFTEIAYGSMIETLNHFIIAVDLDFLEEKTLNQLRPRIEEILKKLSALRRSQLNSNPPKP